MITKNEKQTGVKENWSTQALGNSMHAFTIEACNAQSLSNFITTLRMLYYCSLVMIFLFADVSRLFS
jgi:hypothetical protein